MYHNTVNVVLNPNITFSFTRPPSLEYEVMRVEGSEETSPEPNSRKARKAKRRSESPLRVSDSPTKIKKLKLVLGSETMSTVNYSE